MASRVRRWMLRGVVGLFALVVIGLTVGMIWESSVRATLPEKYPPPGTMVKLGTHQLHLRRFGEGLVTVVLEAGSGNSGSLSWLAIEDELAQFATVVAYDRAGVNWSEPGPTPRTSARIADELHAALDSLGLPGPLVLVGHSQGGVHMMQYALTYRDQVAGLVLLDSPLPNSTEEMPTGARELIVPGAAQQLLMKVMMRTGVMRLTVPPEGGGLPEVVPGVNNDSVNALLTAFLPGGCTDLSTRAAQVTVPNSRHAIQFSNPDVVVAAIRSLVVSAEDRVTEDSVRREGGTSP